MRLYKFHTIASLAISAFLYLLIINITINYTNSYFKANVSLLDEGSIHEFEYIEKGDYYTSRINGDEFTGKFVSCWVQKHPFHVVKVDGWINMNIDLSLYLEVADGKEDIKRYKYEGQVPGSGVWLEWDIKEYVSNGNTFRLVAIDETASANGWFSIAVNMKIPKILEIFLTLLCLGLAISGGVLYWKIILYFNKKI